MNFKVSLNIKLDAFLSNLVERLRLSPITKENNMRSKMRGVILAGGVGTRLQPLTTHMSKQLLPVFDKPMIYYPLATLMLAGIKDVLIIVSKGKIDQYHHLLGDGDKYGIAISYAEQVEPAGVADGINIAASFVGKDPFTFVLGDNIFYGTAFRNALLEAIENIDGATIFAYHVANPSSFGVVELDSNQKIISIEEKPKCPRSKWAITGLYVYDWRAVEYVKTLTKSHRNELEITDLNACYLRDNNLSLQKIGRGSAWFDTGTFQDLNAAANFVSTIQLRQGLLVGSIEEISWRNKWISTEQLEALAMNFKKNEYGQYLRSLVDNG
jgi:glucose-1-phosphate thymidylyltransferase